jgi:hypothetical protein
MPSPFPGMNPFLENPAVWPDFHLRMISTIGELLAPQVSPRYVVRAEAQLYIHELPDRTRRLLGRGDVGISITTGRQATTATMAPSAPIRGSLPAVDIERIHYLEIRDRTNRQVVTVIELLSPSNKDSGADRDQYIAKRVHLQASRVNLVEIDLLRGGMRPPVDGLPACNYFVMVSRADDWPKVDLWPLRLRNRLPVISIPLRERKENASLDLQVALHRVYDAARYEDDVYGLQPEPELSAANAKWAKQFVPSAG